MLSGNEPEINETGTWSIVSDGTGTFTDNTVYNTIFTADAIDLYVLCWTLDNENCQSSANVEITFNEDVTNPVTPTLLDVTGECSATAVAPTTEDACAGTITGTTSNALTYTTQGTHVITWNFDDGNGNSIDVEQNVVIDDITAPVPNVSNIDITEECSVDLSTYTPTATDNCTGEINGTTTDNLIYTEQGTYTVIWTFDDGNGNIETQEQNVVIEDLTAPETLTLDNVLGECEATPTVPETTDNCAGTIEGTTSTTFPITEQGTTVVTWTFADGNGNSIDVEQNVIVEDITDPTINCIEDMEVTADETETYIVDGIEFDPTATDDNCEVVSITNNINGSETLAGEALAQGETHTITWTVTDIAENETTCEFDVLVNNFVGISELTELGISIYPNPSNGIFTIETEGVYEITITDISGKTIQQLTINNEQLTIDISTEASGIYFLKLQNNEIVKTVKIIKE